jgi:Protein of unknown function (DUF1587)
LNSWLDKALLDDGERPDRVTVRRLNRNEYNNTIRALIGLDLHPADDFPSDDVGYGFDNIGEVLSTPPVLLDLNLRAWAARPTPERRPRLGIPGPCDLHGSTGIPHDVWP